MTYIKDISSLLIVIHSPYPYCAPKALYLQYGPIPLQNTLRKGTIFSFIRRTLMHRYLTLVLLLLIGPLGAIEHSIIPVMEHFEDIHALNSTRYSEKQFAKIKKALEHKEHPPFALLPTTCYLIFMTTTLHREIGGRKGCHA